MTIIVISGATAVGKSSTALYIAQKLNNRAVIINADSVQLYQGIDVLADSPSPQAVSQCQHALYGIIPCDQATNVSIWLELVKNQIASCIQNNMIPIIVGGTCMYIEALMHGISSLPSVPQHIRQQIEKEILQLGLQETYNKYTSINPMITYNIKPGDTYRLTRAIGIYLATDCKQTISELHTQNKKTIILPHIPRYCINILPTDRETIYQRCNMRFQQAFYGGAQTEVKNIISQYGSNIQTQALGFYEIVNYITKRYSKEQAIEISMRNIRRYTKRQYTWFRNRKSHNHVITDTNTLNNKQICWDLVQKVIY